ncbi:NAD(P)/FAD-dependent oxidoreductase [Alphaproteobacteria bacterium]|nr:NAD(P)/FAD-dependent oxidoreductase [Alphaproteobacteria bacterium]
MEQVSHTDVIIVGAGISGISSAHHLQTRCPDKSFEILEGRKDIGGTWDLFRYPGVRSDSDMYTLGFSFRPWKAPKAIADAPAIMDYLRGAVKDAGFGDKIKFGKKVTSASWSSDEARWTLTIADQETGETQTRTCSFMHVCAGYYNYDHGYQPKFPNESAFKGPVLHPQFWPEDVDYEGKKVVVIGSGATAVTLVPSMAEKAEHVTMLQRSPTYIVSRPAEDGFANFVRRFLPSRLAYGLTRWRNVLMGRLFFWYCRAYPARAKKLLLKDLPEQLPAGFDIEKHLTPHYNPWDQRVCLAPDGDFFTSLRRGTSDIVTDHIEAFTETGIALKSGETLETDIIVSATGLDLNFFGNMELSVDGAAVIPGDIMNYKGMMFSGLPNLATSFGYTNASWTLRCDLTSAYVCRLLKYMDRKGYTKALPTIDPSKVDVEPLLDFTSGYVTRSADVLPKQGSVAPWKMYQDYVKDIFSVNFGVVGEDIEFSKSETR